MCGIVASRDKLKLLELIDANKSRGSNSWSLTVIDLNDMSLKAIFKEKQNIKKGQIKRLISQINCDNPYYIIHMQAQTTNSTRVHPATNDNYMLWHNGIIKDKDIKRLQESQKDNEEWDTQLILNEIYKYYKPGSDFNHHIANSIANINGGIAAILWTGENIYIFRNSTSILYTNILGDLSSVNYYNEMTEVKRNSVYEMNKDCDFIYKESFKSIDNAYYFPGET